MLPLGRNVFWGRLLLCTSGSVSVCPVEGAIIIYILRWCSGGLYIIYNIILRWCSGGLYTEMV